MRSMVNHGAAPPNSQHVPPTCYTEMVEVIPGRLYWRGQPRARKATLFWNEYSYHNPQGNYNFKLFPNKHPDNGAANAVGQIFCRK